MHNYEITLNEAKEKQWELTILINKLNNDYNPRKQTKIEEKDATLKSAKKLLPAREKIINLFEKRTFPFKGNVFKTKEEDSPKKPTEADMKKFNELIIKKETDMNREFFQEYFKFQMPTIMLKTLYSLNDKKKNNLLLNTIKSGLSDLKNEIKKMSKEERKIEKPDKIVEIVEEILKFNEQQEGKGLKILTPNEILSRLPISLAQLQAGNN